MEDEFQKKYIVHRPTTAPGHGLASGLTPTRYSKNRLMQIGRQCDGDLPPASAVQAMFMYELQRQTEVEKLFCGGIFEIARFEDVSRRNQETLSSLQARMEAMEREFAAKKVDDRLATSQLRMQVHSDKLDKCTNRVEGIETKLVTIEQSLADLKVSQEAAVAAPAATTTTADLQPSILTQEEKNVIKDEITVLFDDRDGILDMLREVHERVSRLEANVRALTTQTTAVKSTPTNSPQLLTVQTTNGEKMDLGVPKGKGLKENRWGTIGSFSPGKQWAQ